MYFMSLAISVRPLPHGHYGLDQGEWIVISMSGPYLYGRSRECDQRTDRVLRAIWVIRQFTNQRPFDRCSSQPLLGSLFLCERIPLDWIFPVEDPAMDVLGNEGDHLGVFVGNHLSSTIVRPVALAHFSAAARFQTRPSPARWCRADVSPTAQPECSRSPRSYPTCSAHNPMRTPGQGWPRTLCIASWSSS